MQAPNVSSKDSVDDEPVVLIMRNLYTDQYKLLFPDVPIDDIIGREVKLLDGLEFTSAVSQWGDTHETRSNNRFVDLLVSCDCVVWCGVI